MIVPGDVYDLTGKNIGGPPPRPLAPFKVNIVSEGLATIGHVIPDVNVRAGTPVTGRRPFGVEATTGLGTLSHETDLNAGHCDEGSPPKRRLSESGDAWLSCARKTPCRSTGLETRWLRNPAHSETEINWRLTMKRMILVLGVAFLLAPALLAQMPAGEKPAMMDCAARMQKHESMQKHMAEMMPKMMSHMTQHMQSGMMKGMGDSMSGCPMMKGADRAPAPAAAEHEH
jgi:hypothetical protein